MNKKLVTVVVPIYNVEKYLHQSVESIRNQTYTNLEIILVDDGSPDRCGMMCEEYAQQDQRIKVIHKKNSGLGLTRNAGIEAANGEWIVFIDSDDWIEPQMVEVLVDAADAFSADMVISGKNKISQFGGIRRQQCCEKDEAFIGREEILNNIFYPLLGEDVKGARNQKRQAVSACTNLYSMKILRDTGLRFLSERQYPSEDTTFNLEYVLHCGCIGRVTACMYNYRYNETSLSHSYRPNRMELIQNLYGEVIRILNREGLADGGMNRVRRSYVMRLRHGLMIMAVQQMSVQEKIRQIEIALQYPLVKELVDGYPISQVPLKEQIMVKLVQKNKTVMLFIYLLLQNYLIGIRNRLLRKRIK